MKNWLYLLILGLLLSSATLAESPVPSKLAEHHALIGSAGNHVEIYWAVPPRAPGKLPVVVYIHGVQGEGRPGLRTFWKSLL